MSQNEPHVLLVTGGRPLPDQVQTLLQQGRCRYTAVRHARELDDPGLLQEVDAALIVSRDQDAAFDAAASSRWFEGLASRQIGVVIMDPPRPIRADPGAGVLMETVPADASADELWGRLATLIHTRPTFQLLEHELNNMQVLGKRLNRHIAEIDQEMRLASRLQRDFLPKDGRTFGRARFASVYRPAGWISGDMYDVRQVDDEHVAFWVADAVGHGVAAGLLTMFIWQSVQAQPGPGEPGQLLEPGQMLARLNETLANQQLPNSQFVTACYCLLNARTGELTLARAGHPYPIFVSIDGSLTELKPQGGLLGIFAGESFSTLRLRVRPGEKLLIFSDGVECELMVGRDDHTGQPRYREQLQALAHLSADEIAARLTQTLDAEEGSLNPRDDLTLVVMEMLPAGEAPSC
jgi:sigma-B regulation protein RsbU (phosphoserine phosphatase)